MLITAAFVQDRDAAKPLLWNLTKAFPAIRLAWADGIYAGKLIAWAITALKLTLQIVRRPDDLHTFKVLAAAHSQPSRAPPKVPDRLLSAGKAARAAKIWHLPNAAAAGLRRVWYLTAIACPAEPGAFVVQAGPRRYTGGEVPG